MSSNSEHPTEPQSEQDLVALVVKMQQQLSAVEKKIDALMVQLEEKSASRGNTYSSSPKPFRPYGQSSHGEGRRDRGPRDRNFGGPRRSFGDRNDRPQGEGRRDFGSSSGERSFGGPPRSFDRQDRPQGGGGFGGPRKKPFFKRRRDRD